MLFLYFGRPLLFNAAFGRPLTRMGDSESGHNAGTSELHGRHLHHWPDGVGHRNGREEDKVERQQHIDDIGRNELEDEVEAEEGARGVQREQVRVFRGDGFHLCEILGPFGMIGHIILLIEYNPEGGSNCFLGTHDVMGIKLCWK